jgi:hypothetical protein
MPNTHGYPTNIVFKENPGGEYRKSYHGYPSGFGQFIYSPDKWIVEPMQIDTHNRATGNTTAPTGYKPAFLPQQQANASMTQLTGGLSPLIECPCSDRISKSIEHTSEIKTSSTCGAEATITTLKDCVAVAGKTTKAAGAVVSSSKEVNEPKAPAGCILVPDQKTTFTTTSTTTATAAAAATGTPLSYSVVFNSANVGAADSPTCGAGPDAPFTWEGPSEGTSIDCTGGGADGDCLPSDPAHGCTGGYAGQCTWDSVASALDNCGKWQDSGEGSCNGVYCRYYLARLGPLSLCSSSFLLSVCPQL